jgi:hypothetical protein
MENKFLQNSPNHSSFLSMLNATYNSLKLAGIADVSTQSDVIKNTSFNTKSIKMNHTKFTNFVFAVVAMLLMFTAKNAIASPGNRIFVGTTFVGAVPASAHMNFCEPDTFRFQITNLTSDPLTNVVAHLVFLERNPVSGAIDSTQEYVKYLTNTNGYASIYAGPGKVDLIVPDMAANESRTIEVTGYLTCSGYFAIKNGSVLRNFYKVSYNHLGTPTWDERFTNDYFPQVPQIIISGVSPASISGTMGTTFTRDITVVNGGFGKLKEFLVQDEYGSSIVIDSIRTGDGTLITNAAGNLEVLVDSFQIAARYGGDTLLGQNKTWVIREYVRVVNCDPIAARSKIKAKFGCNYDGANYCDSSATFNANVIFGSLVPTLTYVERIGRDKYRSCPELANDNSHELVIKNTGTADAVDVVAFINSQEGINGIPYSYSLSIIDTNAVTIQYGTGAPAKPFVYSFDTVRSYNASWNATFNSCFPTYRVKLVAYQLQPIKPGDSVIIRFKLDNCNIPQVPQAGCTYPHYGAWTYKTSYNDPCRIAPVNNAWKLAGSLPDLVNYTRWSQQSPAEMYGTAQDSIIYTLDNQYIRYFYKWPGSTAWDTVPGEYYEMRITVDKGISWESSRMPTLYHQKGIPAVDTVQWAADYAIIDSATYPGKIIYSFRWNYPPPLAWMQSYSLTQPMLGAKLNLVLNSTCNYGGGAKAVTRSDWWFTGGDAAKGCSGWLQTLNCAYTVPINIKCPGCVEGIANIYMDVHRKNYGQQDFNNDGLPDSNSPASDTSVGVLRTTAMYGDTLILKALGVVSATGTRPPFSFGYGRIVYNDSYQFIEPAGGYVVIKSVALATTFTCDIVDFKRIGSHFYYSYSPAALASNGCGIPANYAFGNGDSVWTYPYMKLDQNIGNVNVERQFDHTLYIADRDISNIPLGTSPACNYNNSPSTTDTSCHAYYCNSNQDNFNFVGDELTYDNTPGFQVVRGCQTIEDYRQYYLYVGSNWNIRPFPYETRRMVYPKEYYSRIPQGYRVEEVWIRMHSVTTPFSTTYQDFHNWPYTQVGDSLYIRTDTAHVGNGGSTYRDYIDGWVEAVRIRLSPSCNVPKGDTLLSLNRVILDDKYLEHLAPDSWSNYNDGTSPDPAGLNTSYIDTILYNNTKTFSYPWRYQQWNYGGSAIAPKGYLANAYSFDAPIMKMQAVNPIIDVFGNTVRWELIVTNFSGTASANNVWIANNMAGSGIIISAVKKKATNDTIVPTAGGIYQLGNYAVSQETRYYIYGTYTKCSLDTFVVNLGWNCQGYPTNLTTHPCTPYKLSLGTDPKPADLQTQLVQDVDTMSLCDTAVYEFRIKSTNLANVYHIATKIVLANGFAIIPGSSEMKYPQNGTYVSIPDPAVGAGNSSTYFVDSLNTPQADWIEANGLPGLGSINPLTGGDSTYIYYKFKFSTFCDNGQTPSNKRIILSSTGNSWCGKPTSSIRVATRPIVLKGSSQPYYADLQMINTAIHGCDTLADRSIIKFTNLGNPPSGPNNPSNISDSLYLTVPISINIVGTPQLLYAPSGSVGGLVGPIEVLADDPSYHIYKWKLPSNVTYLDSVIFSIKLIGASETECSDYLQAYLEASASDVATCKADGLPCDVKYFNGFNEVGLSVLKPILQFSNPKVTAIPSPPNYEIATMCVDITNIGEDLLPGDPIVVNFYADVNQNGFQDAADTLLDSSTYILGLNNGATITVCKTFTTPVEFACNYVAKLSNTTCACTIPEIGNISSPLLISLGGDQVACSKTEVTIGTDSLNGYTYNWIPSTYTVCPTCPTTQVKLPSNTTTENDTLTYILRTTRAQLCQTEDTVQIVVQPQPLVTAQPLSSVICSGPPPIQINLSSQLPGSIISWTTDPVPFVTGNVNGSDTVISQILINNDSVDRTVTYKIIAESPLGCIGDTTYATVLIHPVVKFNVAPLYQPLCSGDTARITMSSAVANTTFTWTAVGLNSLPGGGPNITQKLINTTGDTVRVFYTITAKANGCVSQTITASVLVNPAPIASATPKISPICSGATTNIALTSNVPSSTFTWTSASVVGVSGNVAGSGSTITQVLTNSGASPLEVIYIVTPKSPNNCIGDTIWVRVTVNPSVTVNISPSPDTICSGETTNLALTSNPTGATFNWTASGLNSNAGSGTTIAQTLINGTNAIVNVVYTITATLNGCNSTPTQTLVVVNPTPQLTVTNSAPVICNPASTSIALSSTTIGAVINWTTQVIAGVSGNANGTGTSIAQTLTSTNTTPTTVTYVYKCYSKWMYKSTQIVQK